MPAWWTRRARLSACGRWYARRFRNSRQWWWLVTGGRSSCGGRIGSRPYAARPCDRGRLRSFARDGAGRRNQLPARGGVAVCEKSGLFGISATGLGSWCGRNSRWCARFWITTRVICAVPGRCRPRKCGTVQALRNHPSLIAWCGGNEISPRRERLPLAALAVVLAEEDPARPWIPASPCDGDSHHWQVWHGFAPWTDLAGLDAPFMSEFGLRCSVDAATVADVPHGAPATLDDPPGLSARRRLRSCATTRVWTPTLRQAQVPALPLPSWPRSAVRRQRCRSGSKRAGCDARRCPGADAGRPSHRRDAENAEKRFAFSASSGLCGEHPRCGGVVFWQLNEPWPR